MSSFFGRDRELEQLDSAFARAHAAGSTVLLTGPNGIGKTALIEAFLARLDRAVPIVRVRGERFCGLLPLSSLPPIPAGSVVAVDDAHWCAPALVAHVRDAFVSGHARFAIVAAPSHLSEFDDMPHPRIDLAPLEQRDIERIVDARASDPSERLRSGIARWAEGSPYEAVTLSTLGESDAPAARAIARFIDAAPPPARSLAHMLALIGAPVEPSLARELVPDARELSAAREKLAPLLESEGDDLAFDHVLTESAVVETIAMKIPLHRRIIAALERRGVHTLRDRIIMFEQLLGSGDRARAQEIALDLAFAAQQGLAPGAQVWASDRLVELGEPPDERFVPFYTQYTQVLIAMGDFGRAESVASHAFGTAQRKNLVDAVMLGAQVIDAQWKFDRKDAARATYERLCAAYPDAQALALLQRAAPWLRAS